MSTGQGFGFEETTAHTWVQPFLVERILSLLLFPGGIGRDDRLPSQGAEGCNVESQAWFSACVLWTFATSSLLSDQLYWPHCREDSRHAEGQAHCRPPCLASVGPGFTEHSSITL